MPEDLDQEVNFFRNDCTYVLYSGTSLKLEEDAFRHLNDLFLMHFMLISKAIDPEKIILVCDENILDSLDTKTNNKKIGKRTFKEFFTQRTSKIIDINNFTTEFERNKEEDLVFISSGHGAIHGLHNDKNNTYISSDYFEDIASETNRTILLMSQCQAGSFHHLDTRKNICTIGASEYQSSVSLDLLPMCKVFKREARAYAKAFSFFDGVAINPFLFSFFCVSLYTDRLLSHNRKKSLIHIYKYTASSTYIYLQNVQNKIDFELITHPDGKTYVRSGHKNVIQVPYLLNKILAARLIF